MMAFPHYRYTLRNALPLGLLMVVITMLALAYLDTVLNGQLSVLQHARSDAVLDAEHLARTAQRELKERRDSVASDLSVAATDPRVAVLALINAQGQIEMAQRLAWRALPAVAVLPHFSPERFAVVVHGRPPDVQELVGLSRVVVMVPYFVEGRADVVSDADRGVVYLEYDLRGEMAQVSWDAQRRLLPMLVATLLLTLVLAKLLRSRVTQPLAQVEQASLRLARKNEFPRALDETGPREIASLAHSFNLMAVRIRDAQHDIETSRARLAVIFDAAMDAIITVGSDQLIRVVNRAALRMFGGPESDFLDQPMGRFLPAHLRAPGAGLMPLVPLAPEAGLADTPVGRHALVTGLRLNGETFPAEASVSHMEMDGERLAIVMLRDVTERQRAEDAVIALNNSLEQQVEQRTARLKETTQILEEQQRILQAAHAEQRTIFETLTVGIAVVRDGLIVRCNRRLEEIFGYGAEQLIARPSRVWFVDDESHAVSQHAIQRVIAQGHGYQTHQELVRMDGTRFWARITGSQLVDGHQDNAVLVVIADMTLQRVAEQAIQEAGERALEASRAKSNFLANMSHEIRTPMNAIIGLSYMVLKSDLMPHQREQVRKIQRSSQLLLGIVNDVLDYSKIEAGKLTLEKVEFSLDQVLDNVASLLSEKAAAKGLRLTFDIDPNMPARLTGDPLRLGQILVNYADNAVKFTATGSVSIHLELREESATDVLLYGAVRDTGKGLSQTQTLRLFQSFQQADSSTTREFGGTGLGLVICKQLAGIMQGDVGVDSMPGVGSTFWFTARLGKTKSNTRLGERAHAVRAGGAVDIDSHGFADSVPMDLDPLHAIRGARILLVEDNALNREVACELLRDAGLVVEEARNGELALERLQSASYDLVLMDMQMPVMDGLVATRRLRQLPQCVTVPVVAMTASTSAQDRQLCLDAGMNDHVAKPIEPVLLFAALLKWIKPDGRNASPSPAVSTQWQDADADAGEVLDIPEVPGLDVATGLRRVRGKKAFYLSLLRRFVQGQASVVEDLRAALYTGNREEAQRIAHSLKGLAGSVAIESIQQAAQMVEHAIASGQTLQMLEVSLKSLERQLMPFIAQLRERLPWQEVVMLDDPIDMAVLGAVCRRLARLLADDNLEAVDVLTENDALLRRAFGDAFEPIENEVRNFNCRVALQQLQKAARAQSIDLGIAGEPS